MFPPFVIIAIQPVSDVVATCFALLAIGRALRFYVDVAVRPNHALLAVALLRSRSTLPWYAIAIDDNETRRIDFEHRLPGHWTRIGTHRQSALWRLDG